MTIRLSNPEEFDKARHLIELLCDQQLTEADAIMLDSLVCAHSDIRQHYIRMISLHGDLLLKNEGASFDLEPGTELNQSEESIPSMDDTIITDALNADDLSEYRNNFESDVWLPVSSEIPAAPTRPQLARRNWRWRGAAAIVAATLVSIWAIERHMRLSNQLAGNLARVQASQPLEKGFIRDTGLAIADLSLHPVWETGSPVAADVPLHAGILRLKSGIARILMNSGVEIILEGPAAVSLETEGKLRLEHGRLTVKSPHTARGFVVSTPSANVTDIGTEFGISASVDHSPGQPKTDVIVFDGSARLSESYPSKPMVDQLITTGQGFSANLNEIKPLTSVSDAGGFIRSSDFKRRKLSFDSAMKIVKNPGVLSYCFFDPEFDRYASIEAPRKCLNWRSDGILPPLQIDDESIAEGNAVGHRLSLTGQRVAMVDIDTSKSGRLSEQGFVGSDGYIEASGKTLYMSWLTTAPKSAADFGGLSLSDGDAQIASEYIFFGQAGFSSDYFACRIWKEGRAQKTSSDLQSVRSSPEQPVDSKTHVWVLKMQFLPGNDRVSLFLDPPLLEPSKPDLVIDSVDVRFNKLRLACGPNATWQFSRILIGTNYDAVLPTK